MGEAPALTKRWSRELHRSQIWFGSTLLNTIGVLERWRGSCIKIDLPIRTDQAGLFTCPH